MDQFNKVLAAFLLLVVAVGISIFVFSRLGILSRILPSNKSTSPTVVIQVTQSPTPTQTITPPINTPGILGWLSQLGKPKATITPSTTPNSNKPQSPNPTTTKIPDKAQIQTSTPMIINPTAVLVQTQDIIVSPPTTDLPQATSPNITIIPYGSTSVSTYPASGVEILFAPALTLSALFGVFLKHRARK